MRKSLLAAVTATTAAVLLSGCTGNVERVDGVAEAYAVFKYASSTWSVVSKGSAEICPGAPAEVVKHFRAARYGACR